MAREASFVLLKIFNIFLMSQNSCVDVRELFDHVLSFPDKFTGLSNRKKHKICSLYFVSLCSRVNILRLLVNH